jgi:quercetin 2,3-dioxygenase
MIKKIAANDRYHLEADWLSAYWLFSFDRYYDPNNMAFGSLRVFNHDTIQGGAGFPTHSHREMEIVTYVLEGQLAHKDSTGGVGFINPGEVQRMTAGTGIAHSEYNSSPTEITKLLQMWVLPAHEGLTPSYEQKQFSIEERTGKLLPIASGQDFPGAVKVHQDVTFFVSRMNNSQNLSHTFDASRKVFLYVIEGEIKINGEVFSSGDQARMLNETQLELEATNDSEIILIDLQ